MLRDGLAARDGDLEGEAETLSVLVSEAATEGEALKEQDLNNGLQERVTLTVGGLLMLRETERLGVRDKEGLDDCVYVSKGKSASNAPLKENISLNTIWLIFLAPVTTKRH
jgi:hypothetical protein